MNDPHRKTYRPWSPDTYGRQTLTPAAKLPEDDLVFFLIDVVPHLWAPMMRKSGPRGLPTSIIYRHLLLHYPHRKWRRFASIA